MDKCASCEAEPKFSYEIGPGKFMHFCISHIPGFLKSKSSSILLKPYSPVVEEPTPVKTSKKKKTETVVEEPAVEEAEEEVLVEEEVTPTEE